MWLLRVWVPGESADADARTIETNTPCHRYIHGLAAAFTTKYGGRIYEQSRVMSVKDSLVTVGGGGGPSVAARDAVVLATCSPINHNIPVSALYVHVALLLPGCMQQARGVMRHVRQCMHAAHIHTHKHLPLPSHLRHADPRAPDARALVCHWSAHRRGKQRMHLKRTRRA